MEENKEKKILEYVEVKNRTSVGSLSNYTGVRDFKNSDLTGECLKGSDFSSCDFEESIFIEADVLNVKFKETHLNNSDMTNTKHISPNKLSKAFFEKININCAIDTQDNYDLINCAKILREKSKKILELEEKLEVKTKLIEKLDKKKAGFNRDTETIEIINNPIQVTKTHLKERRSEVTENMRVTHDNWVLHLARKTDQGNTYHVFILLEGIENNKHFVWYADFVKDPDNNKNGLIQVEKRCDNNNVKIFHKLTHNNLMGVNFSGKSWNISYLVANELIKSVGAEEYNVVNQRLTIPYQILGNKSASAASSSKRGHNCFTWARDKINNLKEDGIIVESRYADWIVALPNFHLKDPRPNNSSFWTIEKIVGGGIVLTLAALGIGFLGGRGVGNRL